MDILDFSRPQSKECEDACTESLKQFQKQYPSITSGDIQTFILAFRMGWYMSRLNILESKVSMYSKIVESSIQKFDPIELKTLSNPKKPNL